MSNVSDVSGRRPLFISAHLSPPQVALLYFLTANFSSGKPCPSIREMQTAINVKSSRQIKWDLDKLVDLGYLIRTQEKSRNIRLGKRELKLSDIEGYEEKKKAEDTMWTPWKG